MTDRWGGLSFDELAALATQDPEAFEAVRQRVIDEAIARAPEKCRGRLRGLQWRLDQVRARAATPMSACISLSEMMWESLTGEHGLIETIRGGRATALRIEKRGGSAEILPFGREGE